MSNGLKPPVTIQYRKMAVPAETQTLGVESDILSEMVEFQVPKYYTGFDLSDKSWYVDTLNDEGQIFDRAGLAEYPSDDPAILSLWWVVGRLPSSVSGTVRVRLVALAEDFLWQTEPALFKIADTFAAASDPPDPPGMSYFDTVTLQVSDNAQQTTAAAQQASAAAQIATVARDEAVAALDEINVVIPVVVTDSAYAALLAAGQTVAGKIYYTVPDGTPGV
jgi:hypothetical protein